MLKELSIPDFLDRTRGNDPVPGGGSVSALCGTLAAALGQMVANLTIGRKKYADVEPEMKLLAERFDHARALFLDYIDLDACAYDLVSQAFRLPKDTDEERTQRHDAIQRATIEAARVPMKVVQLAVDLMEPIANVAARGNQNAITDACVAMMCARTAALGAALNVRINIAGLDDRTLAADLADECSRCEAAARAAETALLNSVTL